MIPEPEGPKLVEQRTIGGEPRGESIEVWTMEVPAVNPWTARKRARVWARRQDPSIRNIINPQVQGVETTEQATFGQLFPESIRREKHRVSFVVFR